MDLVKYLQAYGMIAEWFSYALLAGVQDQQQKIFSLTDDQSVQTERVAPQFLVLIDFRTDIVGKFFRVPLI